jgi:hypothetical protein
MSIKSGAEKSNEDTSKIGDDIQIASLVHDNVELWNSKEKT